MSTFDIAFRIVNITLGLVACLVVLRAARKTAQSKAEATGMAGGALVCFAVSFGSLGFLLGWPSEIWLPFMSMSLLYVVVGRIVQMRNRGKP
jgi:hypothetical protein